MTVGSASAAAEWRMPRARTRLRIAYVTETYPPEVNGVANTAQRAVEWLLQGGHALQLVRPRQDGDAIGAPRAALAPAARYRASELLTPGMPIPMYRELRLGLARPGRLASAWREQRPDLVHIATEGPLGWAALRAARRLRIPVSSDFRTNFHLYSRHYGLGLVEPVALAYLRWFHNCADLTMVPTRALRASLQALGFHNLAVVGRGVDTRLFSPMRRSEELRREWAAGRDDLVVLYVGRLAPEKNVELVLRAYAAVRGARPRVRLVLVGDGPQRARIAAAHPHAVITGWRRGEALARCFASADLFLFPSMTETFGNVVLEALASGLALVAYAHGAAAEHLRHGTDALLAELGREDEFVALALRAALDARLRAALRAAAHRRASALAWSGILQQFEQALVDTARGRPAHAAHPVGSP